MRYFSCAALFLLLLGLVGCQSASLTAAKLYVQEGESQRALEQLQAALAEDPTNPEIHYMIGEIAAQEGRYADMAEAFGKSLQSGDAFRLKIKQVQDHYWALEYNRGVAQVTGGTPDLENAHSIFTNATVIEPQRLEAWRNLAYVNYRLEDLPAATTTYEHILVSAPGDTATLSALGTLYLSQERYGQAVEALKRRGEVKPVGANTFINLGIAYERLQQPTQAKDAYIAAVGVDSTVFSGHYNLGNFYWSQEQYDEAARAYERAVAIDPEDIDALFNLAVTYISLEDLDRALPLLQTLSKSSPDNATVWRELGRIYAIKGHIKASEQAYERADTLKPQ
ncbi:MAG: tetratricopeptide repeat protein [Candidatus Latescibacteria bacterium]|nr:tetratricopeptide repeat protein [Candidatus Latescibacterota bacterium]